MGGKRGVHARAQGPQTKVCRCFQKGLWSWDVGPRPPKCPVRAGSWAVLSEGQRGSGSPCARPHVGLSMPKCPLTRLHVGRMAGVSRGCWGALVTVSQHLEWPQPCVHSTSRQNQPKQAPWAPSPPSKSYQLQKNSPQPRTWAQPLVAPGWGGGGGGSGSPGEAPHPAAPRPGGLGVCTVFTPRQGLHPNITPCHEGSALLPPEPEGRDSAGGEGAGRSSHGPGPGARTQGLQAKHGHHPSRFGSHFRHGFPAWGAGGAPAGAQNSGWQDLMTEGPAPVPPLAECSQATFGGAASALGGCLLALSRPLTRPAWPGPGRQPSRGACACVCKAAERGKPVAHASLRETATLSNDDTRPAPGTSVLSL